MPLDGKGPVPLGELPEGARATVLRLQGGRGFLGRMTALGFTEGAQVVLLRNSGRGPVIVLVRDTRVALGRGEAQKVLVRPEEASHGGLQQ
jgi:ferrous iron transport protein A